ncbi:MAG TPA: T9SS type A sorting domain-containing protein [Bacteroidetes bacterium]|nr:T9SS type A sorting domain-containing protein [Bacteroidota bacterium]
MKNFTFILTILSVFAFAGIQTANAQTATRNEVAVEVFTGTWCTYCPGSALGADELVEHGHQVAIIEHHVGDSWETTESKARDTYYGITGYPTTFFDGLANHVGGNASTSIYSTYLPLYNTAIAVATPFNLSMTKSTNGNVVTVDVTVDQIGAYTAGNLVLHVVATESHIPDNWLAGLTEVNFVNRDMVPDQNGTAITVTMGNSVTTSVPVTIDASWITDDMEIIAFLQNATSKEIFNTAKVSLFQPTGAVDPALIHLSDVPQITCDNQLAPTVQIRNYGSMPLTAMEFTYSVNGGTAATYNWTGNVVTGFRETISLPSFTFSPNASGNVFNVNITSVNGGATDVNTTNNTAQATFDREAMGGLYTLEIQLDNYGSETSWDLKDGNNTVLASGGPYTDSNPQLITETVTLSNDCYVFTINDAYGDGMCCSFGNGYYKIFDPNMNLVAGGASFASTDARDWFATQAVVAVEDRLDEAVSLYPNPNTGLFSLNLGTEFGNETVVSIHQMDGQEVFRTLANNNTMKVDVSALAAGMYMVKIQDENGLAIKKFTKQ